jgi:glyoxylase-like metal-dependent hydrolase (beta-lactamase superfamily II)
MPNTQIRLIRADNPSPLTGGGTNTYLLGKGEIVVIDPGPDLDSHLFALLAQTRGERITAILVTHAHLDHSALTPRLAAATGAKVWAYGAAESGRSEIMAELTRQGLSGSEGADLDFVPDGLIPDRAHLAFGDIEIEALHLPGHMGCHMGFAIGDDLFSGDHVMAWSTSLVSPPDGDMADYMASLHRLTARPWRRLHPGHGPAVDEPAKRIGQLIQHRLDREAAIIASLRTLGPATPAILAARVYTETPRQLLPAATRNVLAHLIDLTARGLASHDPGPLPTATFRAD